MSAENGVCKKKRTRLCLQQKIEIIDKSETQTLAELASTYQAGKTVIYDILKRKDEIKSEWARTKNMNAKQIRKCAHEDVNKAVLNWYVSACAKNLPISRMILQQQARKISTLPSINDTSFKASNGWLESFIKRHGISFGEPKVDKRPNNKYFSRANSSKLSNANNNDPNSIDAGMHSMNESPFSDTNRDSSQNKRVMSYSEMLNCLDKVKSSAIVMGNETLFAKILECIEIVEKDVATKELVEHSKSIQQTGAFKLVKSIGRNGSNVTAVPENWEKDNILYWPAHLSHVQCDKLRSDSKSKPDSIWAKHNCVIKIQDIETFDEALKYEKQFTEPSSTTKMEQELKAIRFQNQFLMEKFKLFDKVTKQYQTKVDSKLDELATSNWRSGESGADDEDETPIKIECVLFESTENDKLLNKNDNSCQSPKRKESSDFDDYII